MAEESITKFIRKQYDGKPANAYPSLGELVRLKYKGYDVNISDLVSRLEKGSLKGLPLLTIIKKRAAYQRYLSNKAKRKAQESEQSNSLFELQFPEVNYPEIKLPSLLSPSGKQNNNNHGNKDKGQSREGMSLHS